MPEGSQTRNEHRLRDRQRVVWEYSTKMIYSDSDQGFDSEDDKDTAGSGGDRKDTKQERLGISWCASPMS